MVMYSELHDLIHEDINITGEAGLWATVLARVVKNGRRGNRESVRQFIRDGPLDLAAFALRVDEGKLKTLLINETKNGGNDRMKVNKEEKREPGFDLQGIDEIAAFTKQSHVTLIDWKRFYNLPMKKRGIWYANRADLEAWAFERGQPIDKITTARIRVYAERKRLEAEVELGTGDVFEGSIAEIAADVDIPVNVLKHWSDDYSDFPLETIGKKKSRLSKAALDLWFQKHPQVMKKRGQFDVEYAL